MISLHEAIDSYLFDRSADLRPTTLAGYQHWLGKFEHWIEGDPPLDHITTQILRAYQRWLREDYVVTHYGPQPIEPRPLSAKSRSQAYGALTAFFNWCRTEYGLADITVGLRAPRVPERQVEPYTREEVQAMLESCERTRRWHSLPVTSERPTAIRDKAIMLTLLDTGVRASELCGLNVSDLDIRTGSVHVRSGKGGRSRYVQVSPETMRHIRRQLMQRFGDRPRKSDEPLFVCGPDRSRFNRTHLRRHLSRIGEKAGVQGVNVHRFRHTFAIWFLRAGGRELALQQLLGHTTLSMTRRYVKFVQADIQLAHRDASPVAWLLRRK